MITGGNRSLGLETARRLIDPGHTVYVGVRDPDDGDAARSLGAPVVRLDVTDQRSVGAAFDQAGPTGEFLDRSGRIAY